MDTIEATFNDMYKLLDQLKSESGDGCGNPNCPTCGKASKENMVGWRELAEKLRYTGQLTTKTTRTEIPEVINLLGSEIFKRLEVESRGGSLTDRIVTELGTLATGQHDAKALNQQIASEVRPYINALLDAKTDYDAMKARAERFMNNIYYIPGYVLKVGTVREIIEYIVNKDQVEPALPNELAYEEQHANRFEEITAFLSDRGDNSVPAAFIIEAYNTATPFAELADKYFPQPDTNELVEEPVVVPDKKKRRRRNATNTSSSR